MTRQDRTAGRLARAAAAFASNARNPSLRRAQLSFMAACTADWALTVGLGIVAYRAGGTTAVGLVGLLRMVPSALLAPLLAPLADRGRRERVLISVSLVRAAATASAAAVVGAAGPTYVVYGLAVLATVASTLFRPAHSALLPSLCRTGYELASANVVRGLLDGAATLIGPLLAALLLAVAGVTAVLAGAAAAALAAAVLVVGLRYDAPLRATDVRRVGLLRAAAEGVGAVRQDADLAVILGLAVAQCLVRGALTVLTVVMAIDLLDTGDSGVGLLNAAIGAGALVGSLAAALLVDTRSLGGWFAVGIALWGVPVSLIGVAPHLTVALAMLACLGVGNSLIDLGGFTLLGRLAPDEVLARVFGLLESVVALSTGVGAALTSLLVEQLGVRWTLVAVGALCPVCAALAWSRLRRMDRSLDVRDRDIELLRGVPMLASLPLPAVQQLALGLQRVDVPAGEAAVTQGEVGGHYFLIESGRAEVVGDGRSIAHLEPGQGFGEIALLRRVPRTATVRAETALRLQSLSSERFLTALLGYPVSAHDAASSVGVLLRRFTPDTSEEPHP